VHFVGYFPHKQVGGQQQMWNLFKKGNENPNRPANRNDDDDDNNKNS
jgi:hypothetical protein